MARIAIACQGGGSHTAFTAGALGRILETGDHEIVGLSGTSGGAMCAYLAWAALVTDRRAEGAAMLADFWTAMSARGPLDRMVNDATVVAAALQPSAAEIPNPVAAAWGRDRLRAALAEVVDVDDERLATPVDALPLLLVSAVEVLTGEFTLFRNGEVTVDALLASAAVPGLYDAVRLDEGLYWDGLLSQNPPVRQLAWSGPEEIWIVQVYPRERAREPRTPPEIRQRRNELTANLSLEQEVWFVTRINQLIEGGALRDPDHRPIVVRRIEIPEADAEGSRLDRRPRVVERLVEAGARAADDLLASV